MLVSLKKKNVVEIKVGDSMFVKGLKFSKDTNYSCSISVDKTNKSII